ncbi:hypothetical protein [Flavobacterium sp. N2270]|uniref:hypothetical protein n=1 Tax=Flavobacterium sp. N2270 TaxID=2986831 RepID=UPI0022252C97|nr:hypothetical protein [Flavobacterium sp. N2270]
MKKAFNNFEKRDFITIDNNTIEYVEIANFDRINIILGITKDYFLILSKKHDVTLIEKKTKNFLPLLKVLELDFEEFKSSFVFNDIEIADVFPIDKITIMVFGSESNYWAEKCIFFIKELKFMNKELFLLFKTHKNDKWLSQKARQQLFSLTENLENLDF